MDDKIYGLEHTVDTLDKMADRLRHIFETHQSGTALSEQRLAITAAKSYAAVAMTIFNIRSSPAWKVSDDYELEMELITRERERQAKPQKTPEPEQNREKQPGHELDHDGPELG